MIYGYARVSTDGQSVTAQVEALTAAGAARVFRETASGAKTDRRQLRRVIDQLAPGDLLLVTRLDRLARSRGHHTICTKLHAKPPSRAGRRRHVDTGRVFPG